MHTHLHICTRCAILDVHFEIHIIMHKRVYTVTLDIECWDDLKVDKIDWARSINLFPDEFIHSSVQERTSPRPVDRTWSGTIEGQRANRYIPARQKLLQKITDIISELGEWRRFSISPTQDSYTCYKHIIIEYHSVCKLVCATLWSVHYGLFFGVNGV